MSQTVKKDEIIPVKESTLNKIKGDSDKKDSLLAISESRFVIYEKSIKDLEKTVSRQDNIINGYEANEKLLNTKYSSTFTLNDKLVKENKNLEFRVKIFKGTTIVIPLVVAGYFIFVK